MAHWTSLNNAIAQQEKVNEIAIEQLLAVTALQRHAEMSCASLKLRGKCSHDELRCEFSWNIYEIDLKYKDVDAGARGSCMLAHDAWSSTIPSYWKDGPPGASFYAYELVLAFQSFQGTSKLKRLFVSSMSTSAVCNGTDTCNTRGACLYVIIKPYWIHWN